MSSKLIEAERLMLKGVQEVKELPYDFQSAEFLNELGDQSPTLSSPEDILMRREENGDFTFKRSYKHG
jgi:hypothetical protein